MTFPDSFIPFDSNFTFFTEIKLVARVHGAKSNVFHSLTSTVVEFRPNSGFQKSMRSFEEVLKKIQM
jgi:hypothetical protein